MKSLRVLSYNIHKGFDAGNRRFLLHEIRQAIREVDANLVLLQEVIGEHQKHAKKVDDWVEDSHFEYLADEIWPHFAYGKNAVYEHGHHGNAILSKHPMQDWDNHDISRFSFSQRGVLYSNIEGIHVFCLHFGLFAFERHWQLDKLFQLVEKIPEHAPVLIAGDFNDWTGRINKRICDGLGVKEVFMESKGKPARSYPALMPILRMDRIYFKNLELVSSSKLKHHNWKSLSDHCPLFAEFTC